MTKSMWKRDSSAPVEKDSSAPVEKDSLAPLEKRVKSAPHFLSNKRDYPF